MTHTVLNGGEWLINDSLPNDIFIPEDFSEEQKMMLDTCIQFIDKEVITKYDSLDNKEEGLMRKLLEKSAEMGLLGVSIPEEYGGFGKSFLDSMIVTEGLGNGFSFTVAVGAHGGIGTLPILYFGTNEQRQKYVSRLITAEWIGAYGLTEPNSGSDALSVKTTAKLSGDGKHYLLNGQKCWISNGGIADVFTVFVKIDGQHFTAFIVEKGYKGFSIGQEEHKMGIKGSSTVQLYFQDCEVPVENMLGEPGKGHLIAFNILNIGRLKLGAGCMASSKYLLQIAVNYAKNREQFKQPICNFGAIKQKLADMAIKTWASETAVYRVSHAVSEKENSFLETGKHFAEATLSAAEEYAIECAMLKVYCSEVVNFVVDEALQIHGGNGYSDEYMVSKAYRDSRINRIFEGTNEINRLLTVDMMLKRAMKGRLDIITAAMAVQKELMSIPAFDEDNEKALAAEIKAIKNAKKAVLMVAGAAVQKLMTKLEQEQEILMNIADMAIELFVCESMLLRIQKLSLQNIDIAVKTDMLQVYFTDALLAIHKHGNSAINAFAAGDEQRMLLLGLKRFTKYTAINCKEARRRIANSLIESNGMRL